MEKPLVMIVEDDPLLGQIFSKTLESDFEIVWFTHGAEAQTRLESMAPEDIPAVLLLDMNLPGVSGMKIYERLRARMLAEPDLERMHIIVCTADSQASDLLRDDVDLALLKPVSPLQLRSLATRLLSRGRG